MFCFIIIYFLFFFYFDLIVLCDDALHKLGSVHAESNAKFWPVKHNNGVWRFCAGTLFCCVVLKCPL